MAVVAHAPGYLCIAVLVVRAKPGRSPHLLCLARGRCDGVSPAGVWVGMEALIILVRDAGSSPE